MPWTFEAAAAYPEDLHALFASEGLLRHRAGRLRQIGTGFSRTNDSNEEVARGSAAVSMIPQVNELGCTPLAIAGTPKQREKFAAPVARACARKFRNRVILPDSRGSIARRCLPHRRLSKGFRI